MKYLVMLAVWLTLAFALVVGQTPKPWTPPATTLPSEFVHTVQSLLAQGFGDPRGGEYRSAKIKLRTVWGSEEPAEVHGWLLGKGRFLAWDGLVYEPESVGAKQSLDKDIEAALAPGSKSEISFVILGRNGRGPSVEPTTTALLLLAGQTEAAEKLGRAMVAKDINHAADRAMAGQLVYDYAWFRFDRLITAHMLGDDALALAEAEYLFSHRDRLKQELKIRADVKGTGQFGIGFADKGLAFLDQVDVLLADTKERVADLRAPVDFAVVEELPQRSNIAILIGVMNDIAARQQSQPGGVGLASDPIAQALIKEGEAAVDPLIDVIENDRRLTRSVAFGRDFQRARYLKTVQDAAFEIVATILQQPLISPANQYRLMTVEELRAFWKTNRQRSRAERLYHLLLNDAGNSRIWVESALAIVAPGTPSIAGTPATMAGAELQSKHDPSVTDLMAKRALQIAGTESMLSNPNQFEGAEAMRVGLALAKWDPSGSRPVLARLTQRAIELTTGSPHLRGGLADEVLVGAAKIVAKRLELGDESAWIDYQKLGPTYNPEGFVNADAYRPLWMRPDATQSHQLAREIFLAPGSLYQRMAANPKGLWYPIQNMVDSPVLRIPAFRELLYELLDIKTVVGTTKRIESGYSYKTDAGAGGNYGPITGFPEVPVGASAPLRICDQLAVEIGRLKGAPPFNAIASDAARDNQIAALKDFLRKSASNIDAILVRGNYPWLRDQ